MLPGYIPLRRLQRPHPAIYFLLPSPRLRLLGYRSCNKINLNIFSTLFEPDQQGYLLLGDTGNDVAGKRTSCGKINNQRRIGSR